MILTDIDVICCDLSDRYQGLYLNWYIICFNSYDLIKGHYEGQRSSSAISESSSKCYYEFVFYIVLDKTYLGFLKAATSFKMTVLF